MDSTDTLLPGGVAARTEGWDPARPAGGILAALPWKGQTLARIPAFVWALWTVALAAELLDPTGALLPLSAALTALAAAGAWLVGPAGLRWCLGASLLATALVLAGSVERGQVTVSVEHGLLTAEMDGTEMAAENVGLVSEVGIALDPYRQTRASPRGADPATPITSSPIGRALGGNLLAGVTNFRAEGAAASQLSAGAFIWQGVSSSDEGWTEKAGVLAAIAGPDQRYQEVADVSDGDFAVSFVLVRPTTPVSVLLAGPESTTVVVLYPEHSGINIEQVGAGGRLDHVVGGPLVARKSPSQSLQQLARLVGRWLLTAAACVALLLLVGRMLTDSGSTWKPWLPTALTLPMAGMVALAGLVATALVATDVLERIPHVQDSVAYLFQARTFALGRIAAPAPPAPAAFLEEFVLMQKGLWFSKYPPGHPLVLALGVLAGAPWLVSPVSAALALLLTYALARDLYGAPTGLLAQALLACSPWFLLMSGTMMSHPTSLVFTLLFVWLLLRAGRSGSPVLALAAGLSLGMLGASRALTGVAIGLPFVIWVLVGAVRGRALRSWHAGLILGAALPLAGLLVYNRALTGSPFTNPFELWWPFDRLGFGSTVGMHGGHYLEWGLVNTWSNLAELQRWLFGWPVGLVLAFSLIPFVSGSRRGSDWLLGSVFISLVFSYVFYWADGIMYGPRYYYECIAILAILSARGVFRLGELAAGVWPGRANVEVTVRAVALATVAILTVSTSITQLPRFLGVSHGYNGMNRAKVDAVEAAGLHNALVLIPSGDSLDWQAYGSVFWANSPLLSGDVVYARDLGSARNRELIRAFAGRSVFLLRDGRLAPYSG